MGRGAEGLARRRAWRGEHRPLLHALQPRGRDDYGAGRERQREPRPGGGHRVREPPRARHPRRLRPRTRTRRHVVHVRAGRRGEPPRTSRTCSSARKSPGNWSGFPGRRTTSRGSCWWTTKASNSRAACPPARYPPGASASTTTRCSRGGGTREPPKREAKREKRNQKLFFFLTAPQTPCVRPWRSTRRRGRRRLRFPHTPPPIPGARFGPS